MAQPRETSGTTMRLIVDYVRRTVGEQGVADLLRLAGETRPLAELEDEGLWSSYDAKVALFDAAARVTGQPDVARRIGEGALASSVGSSIKLLIGLVGSPAQVARGIARAHSKFSTAAEMHALSVDPSSAVIRYKVHDRHQPSLHDCGYTAGLLSQIPVLFGQPPATVRHDVCQVRGADACLYHVSWTRHARWWSRSHRRSLPTARASAEVVLSRLHDLQETVAELVTERSVDEVLEMVTARARTTVGAQRFLLAASLDEGPPQVRSDGFATGDAERVAALLLAGGLPEVGSLPETGEHLISAPVRSARRDYGRLAAFGEGAFFDHEHDLLRSYAALAAAALDTATALEEARDRRHADEVLLDFARTLLRSRDRVDVARATAESAQAIAFADGSSVMLLDQADGSLRMAAYAGWADELRPALDGLVVHEYETQELAHLRSRPDLPRLYDRTTDDPYIAEVLAAFDRTSMVVMPLWSSTRLWGIVITTWAEGSAAMRGERLLRRLSGLADQAVTALDRAELAETVHRQATSDTLTGLANRREFTDRLQVVLAGQAEHGARRATDAQAAVVFIDLDRFKEVNDSWGHAAGDELLTTVGRRLSSLVRAGDLVARLGGDEFTVLLGDVHGRDGLEEFTRRICDELSQPLEFEGQRFETTPSVGAVLVTPGHRAVRDVLRDADAAMYAAKKAGGNRYVVVDPSATTSTSEA